MLSEGTLEIDEVETAAAAAAVQQLFWGRHSIRLISKSGFDKLQVPEDN